MSGGHSMNGQVDRAAPFALLAAGGTGGHVFPAESLAQALLARGWRLGLITDRRGHAYGGTLGSIETFRIRAGGVAGRGLLAKVRAMGELAVGVVQARALLARIRPDVVIGFGGYASLPGMAAAVLLDIPCAMHEQNAVLGRANRLLAGRVRRIATCYPVVGHLDPQWAGKVVQTGMPVRAAVAALRDVAYVEPAADGPVNILVLGGSQGARILSDVVPEALANLPAAMRGRIRLAQQCRPEDVDRVRAAYAQSGIDATLDSFFADVPARMSQAHLVIARSGASTMAELTTLGRPAILVPYPHAIDDHQTGNARALDEAGGAWLMPQPAFTADALARRLETLFAQPGTLARAAQCSRAASRADAAEGLADLVQSLAAENKELQS